MPVGGACGHAVSLLIASALLGRLQYDPVL
jgi:hypothetical protein